RVSDRLRTLLRGAPRDGPVNVANFRARSALIILGAFTLDRITKIYIDRTFSLIDSVTVIPGFFNIVHAENPGAAFSLLADAGEWRKLVLVWVSLVILAVIGTMLWKAAKDPLPTQIGLALICGGAFGNLYDRI